MTTLSTPTPVVPTISATTYIKDIPTSIAYIVRHFVSSPKSTQETLFNQMISMPDIVSKNPNDLDTICTQSVGQLSTVFNNIYGPNSASVTATPVSTDNVNFNIEINISVTYQGQSYSILNTVTTDQNGRLVLAGNPNE